MTTRRTTKNQKPKASKQTATAARVTFLEHIRELQVRLFVVLIAFLIIAGAAWPFFDKIANLLTKPLGENHELFYLTPSGAFVFIMQVCIYVGVIGALPIIIYQIYRFAMPAVKRTTFYKAVGFTLVSLFLAIAGIVFAYIVILPTALKFLTGFNFNNINAMLTIDSYMSFVMTYLLAGALLFQLPLLMIMIDSIRPQTPGGLMKYQGKIVLGSFIVAALISPTPDALNQTLLASPIVIMYQLGIVVIWFRHRKRSRRLATQAAPISAPVEALTDIPVEPVLLALQPPTQPSRPASMLRMDGVVSRQSSVSISRQRSTTRVPASPRRSGSIDGMRSRGAPIVRPITTTAVNSSMARVQSERSNISQSFRPAASSSRPRTVDGFTMTARSFS